MEIILCNYDIILCKLGNQLSIITNELIFFVHNARKVIYKSKENKLVLPAKSVLYTFFSTYTGKHSDIEALYLHRSYSPNHRLLHPLFHSQNLSIAHEALPPTQNLKYLK